MTFIEKMEQDVKDFQEKAELLKLEMKMQFAKTIEKIQSTPQNSKWDNINRLMKGKGKTP